MIQPIPLACWLALCIQGTTAYGYDHAGNLTDMTDAEGRIRPK